MIKMISNVKCASTCIDSLNDDISFTYYWKNIDIYKKNIETLELQTQAKNRIMRSYRLLQTKDNVDKIKNIDKENNSNKKVLNIINNVTSEDRCDGYKSDSDTTDGSMKENKTVNSVAKTDEDKKNEVDIDAVKENKNGNKEKKGEVNYYDVSLNNASENDHSNCVVGETNKLKSQIVNISATSISELEGQMQTLRLSKTSEVNIKEKAEELGEKKIVLKVNIPSTSISDVEDKLNRLEISPTTSEDIETKGQLCERSPVRANDDNRNLRASPYSFTLQAHHSGGGVINRKNIAPNNVQTSLNLNISLSSHEDQDLVQPFSPSPNLINLIPENMPLLDQETLDKYLHNITETDITTNLTGNSYDCNGVNMSSQLLDNGYNIPTTQDSSLSPYSLAHRASPSSETFCTPYAYINSVSSSSSSDPSHDGSVSSPNSSYLSSPAPSPADSYTKSVSCIERTARLMNIQSSSDSSNNSYDDVFYNNLGNTYTANENLHTIHTTDTNKRLPPPYPLDNANMKQNIFLSPLSDNSKLFKQPSNNPNILENTSTDFISSNQTTNIFQPISNEPVKHYFHLPTVTLSTSQSINYLPQTVTLTQNNIKEDIIQTIRPLTQHCPIQIGPEVPSITLHSAKMRLKEKLRDNVKLNACANLAVHSNELLSKADKDGDTQLMILLSTKDDRRQLEYVFELIKRVKDVPGSLEVRNKSNQSALYIASMFWPEEPLVARFIAETLLEKNINIDEIYDNEDTLIHSLCEEGDSHVDVLVELLGLKKSNCSPYFDINRHNYKKESPLHIAVKNHGHIKKCISTIVFLLSQGANLLDKEGVDGMTALHVAIKTSCSPSLIKILLQEATKRNISLVNEKDSYNDLPLHYAAIRNDINISIQVKVIELLMQYGSFNHIGRQGKTPLALVSPERKNDVLNVIRRR